MSLVWYFAYGSNMQAATFRGRRGIEPRQAVAGRVRGWRVVLDKPPLIPTGESFANLIPDGAAAALGVAYQVDHDEFDHIKLTEGVAIGNYTPVEVLVEPIHLTVEPFMAISLSSEKRNEDLRPSTRYMNLLIEGAIEHRLPAAYVEELRRTPAREPSLLAELARPLVDSFLKRDR